MLRFVVVLMTGLLVSVPVMAKKKAAESNSKPGSSASLEEQLKALDAGNQAPAAVSREKLYAVQTRYLPLKFKSEFTLGYANNLTPNGFLKTQQMQVGYRFHFNDRWSLGLSQAWVDNALKAEATSMQTRDGALPDVPFVVARSDMMLEFNVFYGKFRWSADTVSYFDQYIALGPAMIRQNTGTMGGGAADIGFAFWLGQFASARFGVKDYYYKEQYRTGPIFTHNIHAHLDMGLLF